MESLRKAVFAYAKKTYGIVPDFPFATLPEVPVLRHTDNRKWFALFMALPRQKLRLEGEGEVDVVNLKCPPALSGSARLQPGILPAYHMNREHWITVLLDGSVPLEDILPLVDISYQLTAKKRKTPRKEK